MRKLNGTNFQILFHKHKQIKSMIPNPGYWLLSLKNFSKASSNVNYPRDVT